jgi:hypothetical protein
MRTGKGVGGTGVGRGHKRGIAHVVGGRTHGRAVQRGAGRQGRCTAQPVLLASRVG